MVLLSIRNLKSKYIQFVMNYPKKNDNNSDNKQSYLLEISVHKIKGNCPVYTKGVTILISDPEIILDKTDALCTHALSTILHYATILQNYWIPTKLGLTKKNDKDSAYLQCVDPGEPYTDGGTVIFKCKRIKKK
jgi:uncharacterized repeat protein (TIGR04076 family)